MTPEEQAAADAAAAAATKGGETWHAKLPEDMRADPSLIDFKDETEMVNMPINVARSYINTKKLVGRDKLPMPKTDEEWAETYNRLGRPEAASQYNLAVDETIPAPIRELVASEAEWFKTTAHALGLSDKQATSLFTEYTKKTAASAAELRTGAETIQHESEAALRTEYGSSFEGKMVLMNRGIEALNAKVGGGLKDIISGAGLSRDTTFIKTMVMVGEMMAEDLGLDKVTGGPSIDAATLDEQIKTLQADKAYTTASDPAHSMTVAKVAKLMQVKHGNKPVDALTRSSFIT